MTPTNLDHTLEKYLKLQLSENENYRIELWLSTMRTRSYHGEDIGRNDEEQLKNLIACNDCLTDEIAAFRPKYSNTFSILKFKPKLIATFLFMSALIVFVLYINSPEINGLSISSDESCEKVILNDKAIVWLSSDSELAYSESTNQRAVFFSGEGLFEVSPFESSPILLTLKGAVVTLSGAAFIQTSNNVIEMQVLKGWLDFKAKNNSQIVRVRMGQQLALALDSTVCLTSFMLNSVPLIYLSQYLMAFDHADFSTVVSRIQNKFDVVIVADDSSGKEKFTADFTGMSLQETLKGLADQLDQEYSVDGNVVTLTTTGKHAEIIR